MQNLVIFKSAQDLEREALQLYADCMLEAAKEIEQEHLNYRDPAKELQEQLAEEPCTIVGPDEDWNKAIQNVHGRTLLENDKKIISLPGS